MYNGKNHPEWISKNFLVKFTDITAKKSFTRRYFKLQPKVLMTKISFPVYNLILFQYY